ncbi:MAG: ubiquinol-cytochrome c reductase iron-sulfur subunit [Acidobacteriota bacterium]
MGTGGTETVSRRGFLGKAAVAAVAGGILAQGMYYLRALVPNVLYERPLRSKVGPPDQFADGTTFVEEQQVFVVKEGRSFYAMSAVCTHLGCTVKAVTLNQPKFIDEAGKRVEIRSEFHCPCHGSRFYGDGRNYAGPAPRPLDRFKITRSPDDGQLIVDQGERVGADYRLTV